MLEAIDRAVAYVRSKISTRPTVGVILGSGLGGLVDAVDVEASIPYGEIPGAIASNVVGHSGRLVFATVGGTPVVFMQGRIHYYEGHEMKDVIFMPRVMGRLGIATAVVTNAAGGINTEYEPGDLMLITDHINFLGTNPLRGANADRLGERFPDMTDAYPKRLRELARRVGGAGGVSLREGVYIATLGPTYETPAEIRAFRVMGADAVGMSTVPEVCAFAHMKIPVLGISCVTNMAAGILDKKLDHTEVLETTTKVEKEFTNLLLGILAELESESR
jgi:purine-nucleoside phosphorylase